MQRENPRATKTTAHVPVRTRRTYGARGASATTSIVYCPRREASVDADTCFVCARFAGVMPQGRHPAIVCAGLDGAPGGPPSADADGTSVQAVMTGDVVCVTADASLEMVTTLLVARGFGGVPVVDSEGAPVGVVSKTDLVRAAHELHDDERASCTVGDVMMPVAFTLTEDASVAMAAAMMACEGVHRVPVVDHRGLVVGIVTSLDLARWIAQSSRVL